MIAITVDDGPDGAGTEAYIELAKKYNIPLTFFVIGNGIQYNSGQLQEMLNAGCEIGNHSTTHTNLTELSSLEIKKEIEDTKDLIEKNAPAAKVSFVRAPFLAYNDTVFDSVEYPLIDAMLHESDYNYKESLELILGAEDGTIMMLHTWNKLSLQAMEEAIPQMEKKGFAFVTISELFKEKEVVPQNGTIYRQVKKNLASEYEKVRNLFEGTAFAVGDWDNQQMAVRLETNDLETMKHGQALEVKYSSPEAPYLLLKSAEDGPGWINVKADCADGVTAIFTYEGMISAYGGELKNIQEASINPCGQDITVTEVNLLMKIH